MSFVLAGSEADSSSIADEVKLLNETQLKEFIKNLLELSLSKPELSLKHAEIAKKLESHAVLSSDGVRAFNFRDELLRLLHFKFDESREENRQKFCNSTAIFIGNLFNTSFLSPRLVRYWLSNLIAGKHENAVKSLARTVERKVREDLEAAEEDSILTSIVKMITEVGVAGDSEDK
jgi:hypothetical protein